MSQFDWIKLQTALSNYLSDRALDFTKRRIRVLEREMQDSSFWQNNIKAGELSQELEQLKEKLNIYNKLSQEITEAIDLEDLAKSENNEEVLADLEKKYINLKEKLIKLEDEKLFSGQYDKKNVILSIHCGTGGVDAQDWALMLERMYLRFCENMNFKVSFLDRNLAQEAGIKSSTLYIKGAMPYAWLKSEHGTHRLGRISPFDGESLRQTSFALVEVLPDLGEVKEIEIKDEDLKIDVFRSSGPGGQSVNTTDSAVRLTHLPSGLSVECQSERSQHQNRENALKILKAKLWQKESEKKKEESDNIKGDLKGAKWGQQIRSYILYGNQIVKDHRSLWESNNPDKVLDGDLKECILAYLRFISK
jgi:peptide chain release factor 2